MADNWLIFTLGCAAGAAVTIALATVRRGRASKDPAQEKTVVDLPQMLDAIDEAILVVNHDKAIVLANRACRKFFPLAQDLPGRGLADLLSDPILLGAVDSCLVAAVPATLPLRGDPTGDSHWLASIARLPQTNGTSLVRIIIRDESEHVRTEQIRREFVANASHELRTPLTIVHGYLESLLDGGYAEPELAQRFLKTARRHTKRMARLIEDMLTISKLESNAAGLLRPKEFSLVKCLQRVIDNLGPLIEQQHVQIDRAIDAEVERLVGDRFYWEQILFNLIENAIKINQVPGLVIKVTARQRDDGMVEIVIEDNGMGIPKESLPFIFKRFYRVQKDHSNEVPGTGLGLSIVNRAVDAHGGSISVESEPGQRTAFTILLPAESVPATAVSG